MDALCLFDPDSELISGVNSSWSQLFGYSSEDARHMSVRGLTTQAEDLLAILKGPAAQGRSEVNGRREWRRADGSAFSAGFTLAIHPLGQGAVACLLIEELPIPETKKLELLGSHDDEDPVVPDGISTAVRDRIVRTARQQSALLRLASLDDQEFEETMRQILRVDADTLDVARTSYWVLGPSGDSIVCECLYDHAKGAFDPNGTKLLAKDYPSYFRAVATKTLVPAHDAMNDPRTIELVPYLQPLEIGALLDVPVFLRGELVGVICHEHIGPARGWTLDEQQFAMSIGQTFSLALAARHREEASRSLRQRDLMLAEAHEVIDRALRPGDGRLTGTVVGRYRVGQLIGRGGMGEVYRAEHEVDGSAVALKILHTRSLENPDNVQRFFREARITQSIPSEHVARIFEVGELPDGAPFMAMEILEGHDLGWHLRRTPQLPLDQAVELSDHTARALAALREAGVVHRDLKPSNLFLVDALPRAWKVLDFGLSRAEADPFQTTADDIVGTPAYIAPEQVKGDPMDHRTDLYALAAILYRALSGRPVFTGQLPGILVAVVADLPPPLAGLVRGIPVDVELVLAIGLAKEPAERFANVEEFARAFHAAASASLDDATRARGWKMLKRRP